MTEFSSMKDRICLITGANSGIGRETALALARMGARVVMVCRDETKGREARQDIVARSANSAVDLMLADLGSMEQVRCLAESFKSRYGALHVLINNAGLILGKRSVTKDGYETTFAVNHLAPFLLTRLLLDTLQTSAPARVINVASVVHLGARINFDDLFQENNYQPMGAYRQSKLANILFTYQLAELLKNTRVTVNSLHPGIVATNFGNKGSRLYRFFKPFIKPFFINRQKGAETLIYLASSPEVANTTGQYFVRKKSSRSSKISYDVETQNRLWDISAQLTQLTG